MNLAIQLDGLLPRGPLLPWTTNGYGRRPPNLTDFDLQPRHPSWTPSFQSSATASASTSK